MLVRRRVGLPESNFHVMNRGARRISIFLDDLDRLRFQELMVRFAALNDATLLDWCLMPNHYHMLVNTDGDSLVEMMRNLDREYAWYFNRKYKSSGCLFQGTFRATMPGEGITLAYVSRYIHCNPRDLGTPPEDYRWSSCRSYLGLEPVPGWLDLEPVMRVLRRKDVTDSESYREYLKAAPIKLKVRDPEGGEFDNFYLNLTRHLEEVISGQVNGAHVAPPVPKVSRLVCWAGRRLYKIPVPILTEYLGYSANSVSAIASQVDALVELNPKLRPAI